MQNKRKLKAKPNDRIVDNIDKWRKKKHSAESKEANKKKYKDVEPGIL